MRIALYARKSTESEDRQVQSLADQMKSLLDLADRERLDVVEILQESKSAKAPGIRPEFNRLVEMIESGAIEGILTWSINRLSRNPVDGGQLAYMLQTGKLSMIRTIDRTYLPDDNAILMSIENGMATAYLQDLSRNVTRGMQGKVDRGWQSNKAPMGYLNNPITREIDVDQQRFGIVQSAWQQLLSGEQSVAEIYTWFKQTGITVSSRHGVERAPSRASLYNIFKNRFYMGAVIFKGKQYPGKHAPMITAGEFTRAQELITKNGRARVKLSNAFPFARVFTCAECGCAVVGERRRKFYPRTRGLIEYVYYHCSGSKGCSKTGIRQEVITGQLERLVSAVKIPATFGNWLKQALPDSLHRLHIESDSVSLDAEKQRDKLKQRQRSLTLMRLDNEISETEYREMRADLEEEVKRADEKVLALNETRSRIIQRGHELIDAAIEADELPAGGSYLSVLGGIARRLGAHTFSPSQLNLEPSPIYRKIAMFEPAGNDSRRPELGDFIPSNSNWWALVDDLLNLMIVEDTQRPDSSMQPNL